MFTRVACILAALILLGGCEWTYTPPTVPPSQTAEWVGDFDTGNLSQFRETPWNLVNGRVTVVRDGARNGRCAVEARLLGEGSGFGARAEIEPDIADAREGDNIWYGFSIRLGPDFPLGEIRWQVVSQWHANQDGSPPLELTIADGQFRLGGGYGHPDGDGVHAWSRDAGPAVAGQWSDFVLHVRWSVSSQQASVALWRDGALAVPEFSPSGGTLYPVVSGRMYDGDTESRAYWKIGYYRHPAITTAGSVLHDELRVGASREAVQR